ncbi:MAG: hypothetical protein IH588_12630 [Anaerolineales bacterium]|nr:hypothetical protein [Anaerolineales bacterium]
MDTTALPACPKCKQTDQIQKVTSIYGLNTKEWYETRTTTDSDGHTSSYRERHEAHTQLGLKLKMPNQPAQPTHPGLWYGIGGFVAFILLVTLCPLALIPFSFIIPLAGAAAAFVPTVQGVPTWLISAAVIGLPTLCAIAVGVGLLVWLGIKVKQRFDRDMKSYKDKKVVWDRDEMPRWQAAKNRWDQLYYCLRDETVFIPSENKAVTLDDMVKYLYDPYYKA